MSAQGGHILVTFAALEDATQDLHQTRAALEGRLEELRSYLTQLNVAWVGGANDAYAGYQQMWDESYISLNDILARHTGQPVEKVSSDTDRDFFMSAQEAMEYGVVDRVMGRAEHEQVVEATPIPTEPRL